MKPNRIKRNHRIQEEYKRLYYDLGKRHKICCEEIGEKWCLAPTYIADIVAMKLPPLEDNQMDLFEQSSGQSEDSTK